MPRVTVSAWATPRHQHGAQHRGKESTPHHHGVPSCWNSLPSWSGSSGNRTIACFANGAKTTFQRTYAHNRETRRRNRKKREGKRGGGKTGGTNGGGPDSHIPAHASTTTVAPFRAWRGLRSSVAGGPTGPPRHDTPDAGAVLDFHDYAWGAKPGERSMTCRVREHYNNAGTGRQGALPVAGRMNRVRPCCIVEPTSNMTHPSAISGGAP